MALSPDDIHSKRQQIYDNVGSNCYRDSFGYVTCGDSAWNEWVRWVVLAVIIVLFLLLFMACSCYSARRRRRQGLQPYYGTGWAGNRGPYPQNMYGGRYAHYGEPQQFHPAPPYTTDPPDYHQYGNAGQQGGIELREPQRAYQSGAPEYEPPAGPPPSKKNNTVVR